LTVNLTKHQNQITTELPQNKMKPAIALQQAQTE
jgi:hypothetical protein